jgi:hypothetical protein
MNHVPYGPHGSSTEALLVTILEFRRSPAEFRQALLEDASLEECRLQLSAAGHSMELDTGAKVFLESQHFLPTLEHFRSQGVMLNGSPTFLVNLRARHVIVSERYNDAVLAVLEVLPRRLNISIKSAASFEVDVSSVTDSRVDLVRLGVDRQHALELETGHELDGMDFGGLERAPQGGSLRSLLFDFAGTLPSDTRQ